MKHKDIKITAEYYATTPGRVPIVIDIYEYDDGNALIVGVCRQTASEQAYLVKTEDLHRYLKGEHVQDAFPYLSAGEREFLISGLSPEGWEIVFGPDEDE